MAESRKQLGRDPIFERFLGALVGEDENGTNVTVLSMLARLGVDPWIEASDLSAMPAGPARHKLEALIERFSDVPTITLDRSRIAAELLTHLPRQESSAGISSAGTFARSALPPIGAPIFWIIATILVLGWVARLAQGS